MTRAFFIFGISLLFINCKSTRNEADSNTDDSSANLYAFIGKKISTTQFDPNKENQLFEVDSISGDTIHYYVMDYAFKNSYKVLENVYNDLKKDTINFISYEHYDYPIQEDYENALLYIYLDKERAQYYQLKYLVDPVEKAKDGSWNGLKNETIEELFKTKKKELAKRGFFIED